MMTIFYDLFKGNWYYFTHVTQRLRQFPSWEGEGVGSPSNDSLRKQPTPSPSQEGSLRQLFNFRQRGDKLDGFDADRDDDYGAINRIAGK